jgi:hypothetical protein
LEEQEKKIKEALKVEHLGLIAVDTMNLLYRVKLEDDPDAAMRMFLRQMTALQVAAREQDLYVLVAEQVYTDEKGVVQPFTHRETEPLVGTVIRLEKAGEGVRRANLLKQRSRSVEKSAMFRIGSVCLE